MNHLLILASKSPRRQQLLAQIGYEFNTQSADIDESVIAEESASVYVKRLAIEKAKAIACTHDGRVVLGSDTSVVINGIILGKPQSFADFKLMMQLLSGKAHQVMTGVAVVSYNQEKFDIDSSVVTTDVHFKSLSDTEIENYWASGEPQDKAGGYGIQGLGAQFVEKISGCYFSVVGLPLFETTNLLSKRGFLTPIQQIKIKDEES